jgi:hypothetical protein
VLEALLVQDEEHVEVGPSSDHDRTAGEAEKQEQLTCGRSGRSGRGGSGEPTEGVKTNIHGGDDALLEALVGLLRIAVPDHQHGVQAGCGDILSGGCGDLGHASDR